MRTYGRCAPARSRALRRIPLGIAVPFELAGPLAVAVGGSRRRLGRAFEGGTGLAPAMYVASAVQ